MASVKRLKVCRMSKLQQEKNLRIVFMAWFPLNIRHLRYCSHTYFLRTFIIWTYLLKFACLSLMKKLCWLQQNLELDCKWTLVHMDNLSTSISFASKIGSMFIRCTIVWLILNRKNRRLIIKISQIRKLVPKIGKCWTAAPHFVCMTSRHQRVVVKCKTATLVTNDKFSLRFAIPSLNFSQLSNFKKATCVAAS